MSRGLDGGGIRDWLRGLRPASRVVRRRAPWLAGLAVVLLCLGVWDPARPTEFVPTFEQVRTSHRRSDAVLLDRNRQVIHEIRVDMNVRRLDWTPLDEVSPALLEAILLAEDRRFFDHRGVDWRGMVGALFSDWRNGLPRGASTISMQVAAKLRADLEPRNGRRSIRQKIGQIQAARMLERNWSKSQILEVYLNLVTFRGELQGLAAATAALFQKSPHGLDRSESAILAALLRSPNADPARVSTRACSLLRLSVPATSCAEVVALTEATLSRPYDIRPQVSLAPHVARQLLKSSAETAPAGESQAVICTLDAGLQDFALDTLRRHLEEVRGRNVNDGAVLVIENQTGEVLSYVGNDGTQAASRFVDGVRARRQAGSTLKPLLYALAFEGRLLTPASYLEDAPLEIAVAGGIYRPRNYDERFNGLVSVRTALASSLNVPAVRTLELVGVGPFVQLLRTAGFHGIRDEDYYGPSLALGAADVSLWDLVNAYRSLANGGVLGEPTLTPRFRPPAGNRILPEDAAFLISDILSDREGRSRTFSLESPLSTRFWTAVKTGTSKDMRDNWCIGYSEAYTVGVWVGNFTGEPMWNVSGITGAAPIWLDLMGRLHESRVSRPPTPPHGVVARTTEFPEFRQTRREWFLAGTDTPAVRPADLTANFRIRYPVEGTIFALDPDIPADRQKLFFEAEPASAGMYWLLNGERIAATDSVYLWSPLQGKFTLGLADETGRLLDSVDFEVRGNLQDAARGGAPAVPVHP